jgi:hypothetical protein
MPAQMSKDNVTRVSQYTLDYFFVRETAQFPQPQESHEAGVRLADILGAGTEKAEWPSALQNPDSPSSINT